MVQHTPLHHVFPGGLHFRKSYLIALMEVKHEKPEIPTILYSLYGVALRGSFAKAQGLFECSL